MCAGRACEQLGRRPQAETIDYNVKKEAALSTAQKAYSCKPHAKYEISRCNGAGRNTKPRLEIPILIFGPGPVVSYNAMLGVLIVVVK